MQRILIFITILEAILTGVAVFHDPEALPGLLVLACFVLAVILVILLSINQIIGKPKEDWRLGLFNFFLLYFCLIVGFANVFYLKKKEFKPTIGIDVKDLQTKSVKRNRQIPKFSVDAQREYDKWNELEAEKKAILNLIGQIIQKRTIGADMPATWSILPHDPEPLYKDYGALENKHKELNKDLISYHKTYLITKQSADNAEASIRTYTYFDFLYFSIMSISTVGYGDITPTTRLTKFMVSVEVLLGIIWVLIYLTLVLNRAEKKSTNRF